MDLSHLVQEFKQVKYKVESFYNSTGGLSRVEIRFVFLYYNAVPQPHRIRSTKLRSVEEVVTRLSKLRDSEEGLVSYSALSTIKYKLHHHRNLGYASDSFTYHISIHHKLTASIYHSETSRSSTFCYLLILRKEEHITKCSTKQNYYKTLYLHS